MPRLVGIRTTSAHCAIATGSRPATKEKKLRRAARRQLRVPIESLRSSSMCLRNARTSPAVSWGESELRHRSVQSQGNKPEK
jgi:hypothetical protein